MSAATMMNPAPQQLPHRKPVPARASYNNLQQPQSAAQYGIDQPGSVPRTMTSSTSPQPGQPMYSTPPPQQQSQQQYAHTLSNSTSSTATAPGLTRAPTTSTQPPRRSTSSRSASSASPTSYVALMRKQKATVWCDRAQVEHPDILAKRRAIKLQAARDVAGGSARYSTSSGGAYAPPTATAGIRSKIRHHGAPKANAYTGQGNMAGAGVPMRLSATEVDEGDSDEELGDSKYVRHNTQHSRNGSRGSSMGSNLQQPGTHSFVSGSAGGALGREYSNGSTPPSGQSPDESPDVADATPVPDDRNRESVASYFAGDDAVDAEQRFGRVGGLPIRTRELERKNSEELRRRGSVDDRTMTMGGGRLFVANPDLSD